MANLQVKGIDDDFYEELKRLASSENRSVSQQVLTILRSYLAKGPAVDEAKTPAEVLLGLAGSWEDERSAEEIAGGLRAARRRSTKLDQGL
ncbi:MAG: hypothetical protein HZB55_21675 [Deltaproteobacteria bacterium]|nr:hypothetical protein [Deltaproteobacteria bacterium]